MKLEKRRMRTFGFLLLLEQDLQLKHQTMRQERIILFKTYPMELIL